jgi:hypothetical protein
MQPPLSSFSFYMSHTPLKRRERKRKKEKRKKQNATLNDTSGTSTSQA